MAGEIYNEVTNRLHSVRESEDPKTNHITTGADEVYDDIAPYRINGHIQCNTVTPAGTENPKELKWYEQVTHGSGQDATTEWERSNDTTVDNQKTYGIPTGAKQSDINDQLYIMAGDIDKVVLYANEYEEITNPASGANPQANGWYEESGGVYTPTTDTTVVSGHTYYARVAHISPDENNIIEQKDSYIPTAGAVGRALGSNFEDNLTSTSTIKGLTANQGRVLNEIKANKNGWYEQLVAGASLSLIGDEVDEKATFIERETGDSTATGGINHSVDKGTATIDTIYGNTIKFNQIISNPYSGGSGLTIIKNSDGSITINGTSELSWYASFLRKDKNIKNHVYYLANKVLSGSCSNGIYLTDGYSGPNLQLSNTNTAVIAIHTTTNASTSLGLNQVLNKTFNNYTTFINQIDLTAIFGAGNEPSTVADVEAWLANNIGKQDYYDYNPGSLISLNPDSLVSKCGYNIFMGNYDTTPQFVSKSYINDTYDVISNSGYNLFKIQVKPSTTYFVCSDSNSNLGNSANIRFLDSEGNYISGNNTGKTSSSKSFDTPSNCKYIHFCVYVQFIGNFCINISDIEKNGTYEPYWENKIDLKWINEVEDPTDSTGNRKLFQYGFGNADDFYDIVTKNILIKKTHEVDLGNISTWYAEWLGDFYRYRCSQPEITIISSYNKLICSHYAVSTNDIGVNQPDKSIKIYNGFCIVDSSLSPSDIVNGKIEKLNGVRVRYAIQTPITVEVSEELNYEVEDGGTERLLPENTSTPTTSALVADIRYPLNALDAIRNLQNNFSTQGALYQTFITLCSALNSAITTGTFAVSPDETVVGKFNFTFTPSENTQSVEEPNETI